MVENKLGKELHQRHFKGEKLSKKELETLENWFAEQDQLEESSLNIQPLTSDNILQKQIKETVNQLTKLTKRIQQLIQENDKIRKENARLFQLLSQKMEQKAA